MQLRQSKAFGVFYNHHRCIRHIHPYLYYRSGNHYLCFSTDKTLHFCILIRRFHLPMHLTDFIIRKFITDGCISFLQILDVNLFAFLDQRINNIYLPTFINLLTNAFIKAFPPIIKLMDGLNRLTPRRQFIDDRHIQISI